MKSLSVAYYCHDTFGLGHVSRASKILSNLAARGISERQLLITGCRAVKLFGFPRDTALIELEPLQSVHSADGKLSYQPVRQDVSIDTALDSRKTAIDRSLMQFKPDVVMVDTNVRGVGGELDKSLRTIRQNRSDTMIVAVFRDLIDHKDAVVAKWRRRKYYEYLDKYYDIILVCGDKDLYDFGTAYEFGPDLDRKTRYVGYLLPDQPRSQPHKDIDMLVSVGGGRDGSLAIRAFVDTIRHVSEVLGRRPKVCIAPGPMCEDSADLAAEVADCASIIEPSWDQLGRLRTRARLSMSMFGYNTACEILGSDTPALVIPRDWPEQEQMIRATIMADRRLIEIGRVSTAGGLLNIDAISGLLDDSQQAEARRHWRQRYSAYDWIAEILMDYMGRKP